MIERPCRAVVMEDFPARSGIRQTLNKLKKNGFEIVRLTGSRGTVLTPGGDDAGNIGDSVVCLAIERVRGRVLMATWMEKPDGKMTLAWARVGTKDQNYYYGYTSKTATELKAWIDE